MGIEISEIEQAAKRLDGMITKTPVIHSHYYSKLTGAEIYFKCENFQKTGSFKIRGASNKIMKMKDSLKNNEVFVTASAGNHAQGVAYAASKCGCKSTVVMPKYAPFAKVEATKSYGAKVELIGECFDESYEYAKNIEGIFIHPYNDLDVVAGQGTVGLEILKQIPDCDIIIAPAGGGGLLAGISAAVKQSDSKVTVVGVQAETANAIAQSFKKQSLVHTKTSSTLADGIAVRNPGDKTVPIINKYTDKVICVSDNDIASTVLCLIERCKIVVEPAGATTVAALSSKHLNIKGKKICCLLSGGNIDVNTINYIILQGLAARYRIVEFILKTKDTPNIVNEVIGILTKYDSGIIHCEVDKSSQICEVGEQLIVCTCRTKGKEHWNEILKDLNNNGYYPLTDLKQQQKILGEQKSI